MRELCNLPHETEWVEFKINYRTPHTIGKYISALANAAALHGKAHAYMLWGVENGTHVTAGSKIVGTVLGVFILRLMRNGIVLIGVPGLAYNIFSGAIILGMMALHSWVDRRQQERR